MITCNSHSYIPAARDSVTYMLVSTGNNNLEKAIEYKELHCEGF